MSLLVAALLGSMSGCAAAARATPVSPLHAEALTLRVDVAIAGQLASERGRGAIRADMTGELTFATADAGTEVHSRILEVRDLHIGPGLTRRDVGPDVRVLRAVLLATDDYWSLDAQPAAGPVEAAAPPISFYYELFTRDLAPPAWLPAQVPAVGSSFTSQRRGLHGGIEVDIAETLTLVRVDRTGAAPVAEYAHLSAVRSAGTLAAGLSLTVHERGLLRVDLASGLPLRHTRERSELLAAGGSRVFHNTVTIDATYTTVARGDAG